MAQSDTPGPYDTAAPGPGAAGTEIDADIDARGLLCPLPVLRLRKRLLALSEGQVARLTATDPASWIDVPHFCRGAGHALLSAEDRGGERVYLVQRGPDGAGAD